MDATVVCEHLGHELNSTADRFYNRIGMEQMNEGLKKLPPVLISKINLKIKRLFNDSLSC